MMFGHGANPIFFNKKKRLPSHPFPPQSGRLMGITHRYVRKIFRKTNFSTPLVAHVGVCIRGLEMLVFLEILRTYLMDDPLIFNIYTPIIFSIYYGRFHLFWCRCEN